MRRLIDDSYQKSDGTQSAYDAHATNTKNKRKNFKPRIAQCTDTVPSTVDTSQTVRSTCGHIAETDPNHYKRTANRLNSTEAHAEFAAKMSRVQGMQAASIILTIFSRALGFRSATRTATRWKMSAIHFYESLHSSTISFSFHLLATIAAVQVYRCYQSHRH